MAKATKQKTNYRRSKNSERQCQTCAHFFVFKGTGKCQVVLGDINPSFDSDLWTPDFFPTFRYIGKQGSLIKV